MDVQAAIREKIAAFATDLASPLSLRVQKGARPADLTGRSMPLIDPVAAAIRTQDSIVLIDGVDLKQTTPRKGIGVANKVLHTFWQYGRVRPEDLFASKIKRVGVVLNGSQPSNRREAAAYADAHDYAIDQLRKETELTIEGGSADGRSAFLSMLAVSGG